MRAWRQVNGKLRRANRWITAGFKGLADIGGMMFPGWALQIECKTGDAQPKSTQKKWLRITDGHGGFAYVCRAADEADVPRALDQLMKDLERYVESRTRS